MIFVAVTDGLVVPAPMATLPEDTDVQPAALVTVKVYVVLADKPVIVLLVPVPVVVLPPGILVNVQVPEAGKPFNTTEPVGVLQLGWVIVPTAGAAGKAGAALITTLFEGTETQPTSLVTVKVYVALAGKPDTVVVVPVPVVVPPGLLVKVQVPVAGKPLNTTEPVGIPQAGCVIVPTTGVAGGVVFCVIVILAVPVHPLAEVTVTV